MLKFAKAIGANTDFFTAQAFVYPKIYSGEILDGTNFLGVLICAQGEDVFSKVRQAASIIEEKFNDPQNPISEKISNIAQAIKEQLKEVENLQFLISFWKEGLLYLQNFGNCKAYLLRTNNQIELTSKGGNDELISGHLQDGDKLLLLSPQEDGLSLKHLLSSQVEELEENIALLQQQTGKIDPIAAVLIENIIQRETISSLKESTLPIDGRKARINLKVKLLSIPHHLKLLLPKNKKGKMILAGLFLLFVSGLIGLFSFQKSKSNIKAEFLNYYNKAQEQYTQAQSLLNSDPAQAQSSLNEAKSNLEKALQSDPKNSSGQKLKQEIEQGSDQILKVYHITDWPLFLSLDLIKKDFQAKKISFSLGKILLLDDREKTLVALDLKNKTNQILAGSVQLGQAAFSGINGDNVFIFSPDKGIVRIDLSEGQNPKPNVVVKPDNDWGKISDLFAFSGNVYLLDSINNQVYKYTPTKSGYSDKIPYLKPDQKVDFVGAKKMVIDYSVWVLKQGPEIIKLTGGYTDAFSVSGLDKNLGELKSMFVAEGETITSGNSFAYFLDPDNSRTVVLTKKGQYVSQYIGDKFKTASDFAVDEKEKKIYLLEGNKIYQLDLR